MGQYICYHVPFCVQKECFNANANLDGFTWRERRGEEYSCGTMEVFIGNQEKNISILKVRELLVIMLLACS